jgi:hypothetical protein
MRMACPQKDTVELLDLLGTGSGALNVVVHPAGARQPVGDT